METWLWIIFGVVVAAVMALDLGVLHREAREVSLREALGWTGTWIALAAGFNVLLWFKYDHEKATAFTTCYLTEYALSVDNIFVFLVIFSYFGVPREAQHRVLLWGILGALFMRGVFLVAGVALIERFHWTIYVLGAVLLLTGVKLMFQKDGEVDPEKNLVLRLARRLLPVSNRYEGARFFVRHDGRTFVTPLFLTLLVVETTDVLFAVDSVPAALGISQDTLVLYTSNVFAILGLRSLFFAVSGLLRYLHYLKYGLSLILVFVGLKMLLAEHFHVPVQVSLGVVAGILLAAVVASMIRTRFFPPAHTAPPAGTAPPADGSPPGGHP
jgi:tellurite resistance protein TerC